MAPSLLQQPIPRRLLLSLLACGSALIMAACGTSPGLVPPVPSQSAALPATAQDVAPLGTPPVGAIPTAPAAVAATSAPSPAPAKSSLAARTYPVSAIHPEDLLAAALSRADLKALSFLGDPEHWWPSLPEFNVGVGDRQPGLRFYVAQNYERVGGTGRGSGMLETTLMLYDDEATAGKAFADALETSDKGGRQLAGPPVGTEYRYFTRASRETPHETTLRFRAGPILGRLSVLFEEGGFMQADDLARYVGPVEQRVRGLLEASLPAAQLTGEQGTRLPPDSVTAVAGPVLGTAIVPLESWALLDRDDDPEQVRERLASLGARQLGLRRYGFRPEQSQVLEVVLFSFPDDKGATAWVQGFLTSASRARTLPAGKTGSLAAFTSWGGDVYELQFASGRYVGDVACFGLFGAKASSACEAAVRQVAELWYADLANQQSVTKPSATAVPVAQRSPSPAPTGPAERPSLQPGEATPFVGSWRIYSARLYYDQGGGISLADGAVLSRRLELTPDGVWVFGTSMGRWSLSPITAEDWARWNVASYGPTRKITLSGWNAGVADGPVEETSGRIDFLWVVYRSLPPTSSAPGTVWLKFGR